MPQETSPEPDVPPEDGTSPTSAPGPEDDGRPKGLLEQMDELMAALNADLTRLDADLQSTVGPPAPREEADLSVSGDPAGTPDGRSLETGTPEPGTPDTPESGTPDAGAPDAAPDGTPDSRTR